ncbi:rhomboid family intramembrane serine protease [Porticoccus litoralis]|uniref:Rhomboid family intramembrane serine protease n=1 Tax=Porticoccus litoralis TaxID=434086 RepID=A0AAW8B5P3_9GAMM|nr:rhomboid family intramembrane serine protease [Porticoccus litoralis]MDP1521236.1 rhomboid family intramembrane serine protease [Porticoccus litoralis]TNE94163.1 MAG: rhomboid family intramembrane serine protease [Gammaproteobacteria bacterium]
MTEQQPEWVQIADIPSQYDITEFYHQLEAQGIRFRVRERGDMVELWVASSEDVREVVRMLQDYSIHHPPPPPPGMPQLGFKEQVQKMPVVVVLILLSIVGSAIVDWGFPLIHWFTFQDFELFGDSISFDTADMAMAKGQYWRLITPIFLHFGIFHVAFNSVWMWELGRRVEPLAGSMHILMVVLLMALASNIAQYLWSGPSLFGGMSGVVYGLLGYVWMRNKVAPRPILALPNGLLVFMLVWLFVGMTGLIDLLMSGSIANAAHAAGLVSGMVLGIWSGKVESGGERQ